MKRAYNLFADNYKAGNAWFICDQCSQRFRRSAMLTRWDGLKVDKLCNDPRPPQMTPPNIYPEGIPFRDARPPQDNADRLQDDTYLYPVTGSIKATNGTVPPIFIQPLSPGALSPQNVIQNPAPQGADVLEDDITFITGPVTPPSGD